MQFYKSTWFIFLMLIFFCPVGLFLMWKYKPSWNKFVKISLTVVCCFWCLIIAIGMFSGETETPVESVDVYTTVPTVSEIIVTDTSTEMHTVSEMTATEAEETTAEITEKQSDTTTKSVQSDSDSKNQNNIKETTTQNPDAQIIVYYTKTGKRYHNENPCGNGTYYPITLEEAKNRGLTPCEKCVLH